MDCTVLVYVITFFLLSMGSISVASIGILHHWLWPRLAHVLLEHGLPGLIEFASVFLQSSLFFVFSMRTTAASVSNTVRTGLAPCPATGRPLPFEKVSLKASFKHYFSTTYAPGLIIFFFYTLYRLLVDESGGFLPMYLPLIAAATWILLPTLFSPHPIDNLSSIRDLLHFLLSTQGEHSFYQFSVANSLELMKSPISYLLAATLVWVAVTVSLVGMAFATFCDYMFYWLLAWFWLLLTSAFHWKSPNTFSSLLYVSIPIISMLVFPYVNYQFPLIGVEFLYSGQMFFSASKAVVCLTSSIILGVMKPWNYPAGDRGKPSREKLDRCLSYVHDLTMYYHLRLISGLILWASQSLFLAALALLDYLAGLQSALFFNSVAAIGGVLFRPLNSEKLNDITSSDLRSRGLVVVKLKERV